MIMGKTHEEEEVEKHSKQSITLIVVVRIGGTNVRLLAPLQSLLPSAQAEKEIFTISDILVFRSSFLAS